MALTGLQIFKLLPKKNCKECGFPTCLAFAMALASSKTTLDACPYASDACKEELGGATAPPVAKIAVGTGDKERIMGDEVVLFRHDKTFYHPTCFAIQISDALEGAQLDEKIAKVNDLTFERVGQHVSIDLVAVANTSGDADKFAACVKQVHAKSDFALMLISNSVDAMAKALEICGKDKPLVYGAHADNADAMVALAAKYDAPVAIVGKGLENTAELAEKAAGTYKNLVLDFGTRTLSQATAELLEARRLAIKKKFRPFGYPMIAFAQGNAQEQVMEAAAYMAKYASIVVLSADEKSQILPLTAWRMNLYSDPQKPSQVEPGIFPIGAPDETSPVYVTTNFALTYYTVEGELSGSKIPCWLVAMPTDGTSVLTAWAAGKFTGDKIAAYLADANIMSKVTHKELIIPGYVAVIKGALEEKSGCGVIVAPPESAGLPAFAKARAAK